MQKLVLAAAVTAALAMLPVSFVTAADMQGKHHRIRSHAHATEADPNPAVRGGYVMNGNFDWRRRDEHVPWYAHGYGDSCVAWEKDAYHYACDPNSRY